MKLVIGVLFILGAFWYLNGTIRMWPPGTHRGRMLRPSTKGDIVFGIFLVLATLGTGVAFISGASWNWLLLGVAAPIIWSIIAGKLKR